ncbi:unnamed protein product, partial [Didymodactylos carnosus]
MAQQNLKRKFEHVTFSPSINFEEFGLKFYQTIRKNNEQNTNIFLSPLSVALAMSMCANGAETKTLEQMLQTLHYSSLNELNQTVGQIMKSIILPTSENDHQQLKLKLANRLYGQQNYKLNDQYLSLLKQHYLTDIKLVDFENSLSSSTNTIVQEINQWVEKQTNHLIRNLLSSNDINRDTRLILINCIYFK